MHKIELPGQKNKLDHDSDKEYTENEKTSPIGSEDEIKKRNENLKFFEILCIGVCICISLLLVFDLLHDTQICELKENITVCKLTFSGYVNDATIAMILLWLFTLFCDVNEYNCL